MNPITGVLNRVKSVYDSVYSYVSPTTPHPPSDWPKDDSYNNQSEERSDSLAEGGSKGSIQLSIDALGERILRLGDIKCKHSKATEEKHITDILQNKEDTHLFASQTDTKGYSLLQHAAHVGSLTLCRFLISTGSPVDGPGRQSGNATLVCSPPLHIACQAGHVHIVHLLLNSGARCDLSAPLCYPRDDAHTGSSSACRRFVPLTDFLMGLGSAGSADRNLLCPGDPWLPVQLLLDRDAHNILDIFLQPQHASWIGELPIQQLFTDACRLGAECCIRRLLAHLPIVPKSSTPPSHSGHIFTSFAPNTSLSQGSAISLDLLDEAGFSPFLYAVASCRLDMLSTLISLGANPLQESRNNETSLHIVFKHMSHFDDLAARVHLLLGSGLEATVGHQDSWGQTALHCLVSHVNTNYRYLSALNGWSPAPTLVAQLAPAEHHVQALYQRQVLECLSLLLRHNCPTQLVDNHGYTALGQLISTFSSFLSNDVDPNFASPLSYLYVFHVHVLAEALDLFYSNGCSPNQPDTPPNVPFQPPLKRLLHGILNISPVQYHQFREGYLECLCVLLKHGASTNFHLQNNQGTCISLVAALAESVLNTVGVPRFEYSRSAKEANCAFIDDILRILLRAGMQTNYQSKRTRPFLQGGQGNALCDFVHLTRVVTDLTDLRFIRTWLITLLQHGADPEVEPYPAEPIIVHSQSCIFLRHQRTLPFNQLLHYAKENNARLASCPEVRTLFYLLSDTVTPGSILACLNDLSSPQPHHDPNAESPIYALAQHLRRELSVPSLKRLSRLSILKHLRGHLNHRAISTLCLPVELDRYILQIEH